MKKPKSAPENEWLQYKQAAENYRIATKFSGLEKDYSQWEQEVQEVLEELDDSVKAIQGYDPSFQKELEISYIKSMPNDETALLTFCITNKGSVGFVVSRSNGIQSVDIPSFKIEEFNLAFQAR